MYFQKNSHPKPCRLLVLEVQALRLRSGLLASIRLSFRRMVVEGLAGGNTAFFRSQPSSAFGITLYKHHLRCFTKKPLLLKRAIGSTGNNVFCWDLRETRLILLIALILGDTQEESHVKGFPRN